MTVKLTLTGVDTSSWTSTGNSGIWMGIGWDTTTMKGGNPLTDYNSCKFIWKNAATDAFTFNDWNYPSTAADLAFVFTETQSLTDTQTNTKDKAAGNFECQFTRLCNTGDTSDTVIPLYETFNIIRAWGLADSSSTR